MDLVINSIDDDATFRGFVEPFTKVVRYEGRYPHKLSSAERRSLEQPCPLSLTVLTLRCHLCEKLKAHPLSHNCTRCIRRGW